MSIREAEKMKTRAPEGWTPGQMQDEAVAIGSVVLLHTQWYPEIMKPLLSSASEYLQSVGVRKSAMRSFNVPGSFELPLAALQAIRSLRPAFVVALGCVVKGETPHFDHVCSSVSQGLMRVQLDERTPVGFGVLTVDNMTQAIARKEKGSEAAQAAFFMHLFNRRFGI